MGKNILPLLLACALLLSGCTAQPEPPSAPSPTPSVSAEDPRPGEAVQTALIRDYMGSGCRGTDGGLFSDGWCGAVRIQKLELSCDGETVTGTVEGVSGDREYVQYFRAAVRGVVGMAGGEPCVESLTYGDRRMGPIFWLSRAEEAMTNEDKQVVAQRWYDQGVISFVPHTAAEERVNAYFEAECGAFVEDGKSNFWDMAEMLLAQTGLDRFVGVPLRDTITTELTYLDENLLSVKKTRNWFMAGTSPVHYSGDTFDLQTGERLDLDHFVKMGIADFNDWVTNQVCELGWSREEVEKYYSELTFADYQYAYDGERVLVFLEEPFVAGGAPVLRYEL